MRRSGDVLEMACRRSPGTRYSIPSAGVPAGFFATCDDFILVTFCTAGLLTSDDALFVEECFVAGFFMTHEESFITLWSV
jgi:hypothetical protein